MTRPHRRVRGLCLALAVGSSLASSAARADDPPAPAPSATPAPDRPRDRRLLNGHAFLPSTVGAPIAVSSFGLDSDFSGGSATGPTYDIHGDPTGSTRTYSWVGMGESIRFQIVFLDQLVLRGAITTSVASGSDSRSALVVGTSVQAGVALGAEWSLPIGDRVRFGAGLDVDGTPQLNLLVAAAVIHALKAGQLDPAGLLEVGNTFTVLPSLSVAWVPAPAFGLAARVAYLGSSVDAGTYGTTTRQGLGLGLTADADLEKVWRVPLGLGFTYTETIPVDGTPAGIRNLSLSLMYTGKKDLVVGALVGERILNIRPQYDVPLKSSSVYLNVVLRTYWP